MTGNHRKLNEADQYSCNVLSKSRFIESTLIERDIIYGKIKAIIL